MNRWLRRAAWLALLLALAAGGLWLWGLAQVVRMPIERQATIALPGLPKAAAPYHVALLSDIHFGNRAMRPERLARIVAAVNAEHPDLILIAGDFVNGEERLESDTAQLSAALARLTARDGVIAVPGNHDHWPDPAAVHAALAKAGITLLANQAKAAGPLLVLGLDDMHSGHADIPALLAARAAQPGGAPVVLTHSPASIPHLPAGLPLVLAGHTHCGQVVLPGIGSLAQWAGRRRLDPHYLCGRVQDPGRTVVVSGGVGSGSVPIRIGAPSEWWLITLVAG